MNIAFINAVPYGSTGRILFQLADAAKARGHNTLCTTGFTWVKVRREDTFITSSIVEKTLHTYLARFTGRIGTFSRRATKRLLKKLDRFAPDVIHLHNLHGWFLNLPMLFDYIKEKNIRVIWTLHDCWAFTGHCPHFDMCGCEKWKTGCHSCSQHRLYPASLKDASEEMYEKKRAWFCGVENLTLVTPSHWLEGLVKQSFLKDYPTRTIHNGIDLSVFRPRTGKMTERFQNGARYTILGVSYAWDEKKGLDVFRSLAEELGENYRILLVGTDENTRRDLPANILTVDRTQNREELAELYTLATVFVNPTREENYPTVNMEAIACGTPVITFATGGSPEIPDEKSGESVEKNDVDALRLRIRAVCEGGLYPEADCLSRAEAFDEKHCIDAYLSLYEGEGKHERTATRRA